MRPLSATSVAGLESSVVTPLLISPKAADTFRLGDGTYPDEKICFVAAFGALTDFISPLAPLPAISKVEFFDGSSVVATANAFPWIAYVSSATLGVGAHTIKCRVTYGDGAVVDSATKSITVAAAPGNPSGFAAVKGWWNGTDLSKYTPSNPTPGTRVSALVNNQGAAVFSDLTQATGSAQPTVDWIRGLPCTLFGTQGGEHLNSIVVGSVAQPWQEYQGFRQCGSGTAGTVWAGTGGNFTIASGTGDWSMDGRLNANVTLTATAMLPDSTSHVLGFQAQAAGYIHRDGSVLASGTTGSHVLTTPFAVGAGSTGSNAVSAGFTDIVFSTGLSSSDQTTVENNLIHKTHADEPAAKRFDAGDSLTIGTGSANGMGERFMTWFGSGGVSWAFSQAKVGGRWVESHGPLSTGTSGRIGFIDDQEYGNSGQGINFMLANIGARINAGNPYAGMDFVRLEIGAANARNLGGETFVPGTGPGSTFDGLVQLGILIIDAPVPGICWCNLIDSNPAFGTGAGTPWANIRIINGYFLQVVAAVRAARPAAKIAIVDQFNFIGPWSSSTYFDQFHLNDTGYAKYGQAWGQGIAQLCAML